MPDSSPDKGAATGDASSDDTAGSGDLQGSDPDGGVDDGPRASDGCAIGGSPSDLLLALLLLLGITARARRRC